MKSSMYRNLAVITCALGLLGLVAGCLGLSVSFESDQPNVLSTLADQTPTFNEKTAPPTASDKVISASVRTTPSKQSEKPSPENSSPVLPNKVDSNNKSKNLGSLRMSNQTNQPVRIALLARHLADKSSSASKTKYNLPAHWDFDPQEGSENGLILSLPEGNLKLEKGDILVAFAQDGSRRYWGPYVVGETSSPKWNSQTKEWQLVLTP
ncbi:hypothetical protein H6G06_00135 [Anabaena sphaerica FACHB-251]|uniref:Uncharacterized protein n=1 Tax=Anabaena sphaerica FACHB-251 TaxID=2692883 RepID=A0A926WCA4_9NOST|nr:hypothetical protein [Anabaena sphaerica]MBD2291924.1 hypothetical protein [Anabaena sphaerica FACHB-251]